MTENTAGREKIGHWTGWEDNPRMPSSTPACVSNWAPSQNVISSLWSGTGMDQSNDQWGASSSSTISSGWGGTAPMGSSKAEGWGSPSASPAPCAGTEGWGQSTAKPNPRAWGSAPPTNSSASSSTGSASSPSWSQQDEKATGGAGWSSSSPSGWDTPPNTSSAGWAAEVKPQTSQSVWGSSGQSGQSPSWPSAVGASAASGWDSTASTTSSTAWGAPPPPPDIKPPTPDSSQPSEASEFPSTWAQAAGKGLHLDKQEDHQPTEAERIEATRRANQERIIQQAVNAHEGWGKQPVRQDTEWNTEEILRPPPPPVVRRGSNSEEPGGSQWNNNNGTAIWEQSKAPESSGWGSRGGQQPQDWQQNRAEPQSRDMPGNREPPPSDRGRDNDGGHWMGPPGSRPPSQQWGGSWNEPQKDSWESSKPGDNNMWGGGSSKDSSSNWNDQNDDNVWDRNGTNHWGTSRNDHSNKTETGHWPPDSRRPSGGNWVGDQGKQNWPSGNKDSDPYWNEGNNNWGQRGTPPGSRPPSSMDRWSQPPNRQMNWNESNRDDQQYWSNNPAQGPRPVQWNDNQWANGPKPRPPGQGWGDADWNAAAKKGPPSMPQMGMNRPQPQMRSKLLQQLMEMGFKKEEAQGALINNNMILESAIADLMRSRQNEYDLDAGRKVRGGIHHDNFDPNDLMPPGMPNTPFSNAQPQPNQAMINNMMKGGPSLPNISSPGFPAIQAKVMQQQQQQQQQQAIRNLPPQHMVQQQLLHQVRAAVQAGLVGPHLLNQPLSSNIRMMVAQLVQLQDTHQQLLRHQVLMAQGQIPGKPNQMQSRLTTEQLGLTITKIKQQMVHLQSQIQGLASKQQVDPLTEAMKEMNVAPKTPSTQPNNPQPPSTGSRLNQWKLSSSDNNDSLGNDSLNKAVGSNKSVQPSHSTSNLPPAFSDSTWSSGGGVNSKADWPTSSAISTGSTSSSVDSVKDNPKESPLSEQATGNTENSLGMASLVPTLASSTADGNDTIPEFVPGKPWQGFNTKTAEEDPYATPGSISRPSLSVNTIRDESLTSLNKTISPGMDDGNLNGGSTWSLGSLPRSSSSVSRPNWGSSGNLVDNSMASSLGSELWGVNSQARGGPRPPPGLSSGQKMQQSQQHGGWQASGLNRSVSWAPGDRSAGASWGTNSNSQWLLMKVPQQINDVSQLRQVCAQQGAMQNFFCGSGLALVRYATREDAQKAQKGMGIPAEIMADHDATRLAEHLQQQSQHGGSSMVSQQPQAPNSMWPQQQPSLRPSGAFTNGLWAPSGGFDDQSAGLLQGAIGSDLLGGQM